MDVYLGVSARARTGVKPRRCPLPNARRHPSQHLSRQVYLWDEGRDTGVKRDVWRETLFKSAATSVLSKMSPLMLKSDKDGFLSLATREFQLIMRTCCARLSHICFCFVTQLFCPTLLGTDTSSHPCRVPSLRTHLHQDPQSCWVKRGTQPLPSRSLMTHGDLNWEDREYRNVREPQLRRSVDCAGMVG